MHQAGELVHDHRWVVGFVVLTWVLVRVGGSPKGRGAMGGAL